MIQCQNRMWMQINILDTYSQLSSLKCQNADSAVAVRVIGDDTHTVKSQQSVGEVSLWRLH